ncbi:MAG: TetR/AcrR family transcriptional regulator [Chloroflexota bacterium]
MLAKAEQKKERIIVAAVDILAEHGDSGLTMRQVAKETQMALSNVQYYYRNKDALLAGLIDFYLNVCYEAYQRFVEKIPEGERLEASIRFLLVNPEMETVCQVFKELWAISERNEAIKTHLNDHYRFYAEQLANELKAMAPPDCTQQQIDRAVSLILPLVEGYNITSDALPLNETELVKFLTAQVLSIIGSPL